MNPMSRWERLLLWLSSWWDRLTTCCRDGHWVQSADAPWCLRCGAFPVFVISESEPLGGNDAR